MPDPPIFPRNTRGLPLKFKPRLRRFRGLMRLRPTCMHAKVSELARRYRFSPDAIYAWLRSGLIPQGCVIRAGNSIRIDAEEFERLMRAGKLYRPRRTMAEVRAMNSRDTASSVGFSDDQHTTHKERGCCQHRFVADDGASVCFDHPYSPGVKALTP